LAKKLVSGKVTQFRHLHFNLIFSCLRYKKTSVRRELNGYVFHDVREKQQVR